MPRLLNRLIALSLVPCLLAEPAAASMVLPCRGMPLSRSVSTTAPFQEQALIPALAATALLGGAALMNAHAFAAVVRELYHSGILDTLGVGTVAVAIRSRTMRLEVPLLFKKRLPIRRFILDELLLRDFQEYLAHKESTREHARLFYDAAARVYSSVASDLERYAGRDSLKPIEFRRGCAALRTFLKYTDIVTRGYGDKQFERFYVNELRNALTQPLGYHELLIQKRVQFSGSELATALELARLRILAAIEALRLAAYNETIGPRKTFPTQWSGGSLKTMLTDEFLEPMNFGDLDLVKGFRGVELDFNNGILAANADLPLRTDTARLQDLIQISLAQLDAVSDPVIRKLMRSHSNQNPSHIRVVVARNLPVQAARTLDNRGRTVIVLREGFVRSLLDMPDALPTFQKPHIASRFDGKAVAAWILAERLFHELGHTDLIHATPEEKMREERDQIYNDYLLYKNHTSMHDISGEIRRYFFFGPRSFNTGSYFGPNGILGLLMDDQMSGRTQKEKMDYIELILPFYYDAPVMIGPKRRFSIKFWPGKDKDSGSEPRHILDELDMEAETAEAVSREIQMEGSVGYATHKVRFNKLLEQLYQNQKKIIDEMKFPVANEQVLITKSIELFEQRLKTVADLVEMEGMPEEEARTRVAEVFNRTLAERKSAYSPVQNAPGQELMPEQKLKMVQRLIDGMIPQLVKELNEAWYVAIQGGLESVPKVAGPMIDAMEGGKPTPLSKDVVEKGKNSDSRGYAFMVPSKLRLKLKLLNQLARAAEKDMEALAEAIENVRGHNNQRGFNAQRSKKAVRELLIHPSITLIMTLIGPPRRSNVFGGTVGYQKEYGRKLSVLSRGAIDFRSLGLSKNASHLGVLGPFAQGYLAENLFQMVEMDTKQNVPFDLYGHEVAFGKIVAALRRVKRYFRSTEKLDNPYRAWEYAVPSAQEGYLTHILLILKDDDPDSKAAGVLLLAYDTLPRDLLPLLADTMKVGLGQKIADLHLEAAGEWTPDSTQRDAFITFLRETFGLAERKSPVPSLVQKLMHGEPATLPLTPSSEPAQELAERPAQKLAGQAARIPAGFEQSPVVTLLSSVFMTSPAEMALLLAPSIVVEPPTSPLADQRGRKPSKYAPGEELRMRAVFDALRHMYPDRIEEIIAYLNLNGSPQKPRFDVLIKTDSDVSHLVLTTTHGGDYSIHLGNAPAADSHLTVQHLSLDRFLKKMLTGRERLINKTGATTRSPATDPSQRKPEGRHIPDQRGPRSEGLQEDSVIDPFGGSVRSGRRHEMKIIRPDPKAELSSSHKTALSRINGHLRTVSIIVFGAAALAKILPPNSLSVPADYILTGLITYVTARFLYDVVFVDKYKNNNTTPYFLGLIPNAYFNPLAFERQGKIYSIFGVSVSQKFFRRLSSWGAYIYGLSKGASYFLQMTKYFEVLHSLALIWSLQVLFGDSMWNGLFLTLLNLYMILLQRFNRPIVLRYINRQEYTHQKHGELLAAA
jgi:hypothetical protein